MHLVEAVVQELELLGLRHSDLPRPTRFCVSGCAEQFANLSVQWLGYTPAVESITLPTASAAVETAISVGGWDNLVEKPGWLRQIWW